MKTDYKLKQSMLRERMLGNTFSSQFIFIQFEELRRFDPELTKPILGYMIIDESEIEEFSSWFDHDFHSFQDIVDQNVKFSLFETRPEPQPGQYVFRIDIFQKVSICDLFPENVNNNTLNKVYSFVQERI